MENRLKCCDTGAILGEVVALSNYKFLGSARTPAGVRRSLKFGEGVFEFFIVI